MLMRPKQLSTRDYALIAIGRVVIYQGTDRFVVFIFVGCGGLGPADAGLMLDDFSEQLNFQL